MSAARGRAGCDAAQRGQRCRGGAIEPRRRSSARSAIFSTCTRSFRCSICRARTPSAAAFAICACARMARRTSPEPRWRTHHEPAPKTAAAVLAHRGRWPWPRWRGPCWCAFARSSSSAIRRRRRSLSASFSASFSIARRRWPRRWTAWPQASARAPWPLKLRNPATRRTYLTEAQTHGAGGAARLS